MTNSETVTIPAGYKQTEVGVIPEDWEVKGLGLAAKFIGSGKTNTKGSGDYTLYGSTGVIGSCKEAEYEGNSILVARVGANAGNLYYVTGHYGVSDNTIIIKLGLDSDLDFYKYQLARINLNSLVFGSGQPLITGSQLKAILLPTPRLQEQTAIANALSDVDNLIAALETLIAKKSAIKTAAMQQLLTGKKRLPAFAGEREGQHLKANEQCTAKPNEQHRTQPNNASDTPPQHHSDAENNQHTPRPGYKHTELGEIPEDWDEYLLSELCDVRDGTHDSPKYRDSGIPLITSKNIVNDRLDLDNVSFISVDDATEINKRSKVHIGDIIMSMIGTVGSAVLINTEPNFCIKNVALFKPNKIEGVFLIQLIRSSFFQKYLEDSIDGGIQKFVSLGTLRGMEVAVPNKKEQTAIANVLSDMDSELDALQQRLSKTQKIKQGMMQELLTGKTRLINCKEAKQ